MQDIAVPEEVMLAIGQRQQPVALQRGAFRAEHIAYIRIAIAEKMPLMAAKRALPHEFTGAPPNGSA
jgi:hypothetical protein